MTIQRYRLDFQTLDAHNSTRLLPQSDGQLVLYGDHLKAMKAKDAGHLARLAEDAKVRAGLVEALEIALSYTDSHLLKAYERDELEKMQAALAATKDGPTSDKPKFTFVEITPEEAQRRYLKSMKEIV